MLRRALALLASMLLVAVAANAATDPGKRAPVSVGGGAVNDVALASDWLAIATQDPGGRLAVPPAPSADVWQLYNLVGGISRQAGDADIDACGGGATFDDCTSHATHVGLSADGTRMVVASAADDGNPILTFVRESSGPLNAVRAGTVGTPADLAMSEDGQTIVLVTNTGTASPTGHVYLFTWASGSSSSPNLAWSDDLSGGAVSDVGLSPDGSSLAVLQGNDHHRYRRGSNAPVTDTNFAGAANDVAVSNSARHVSVAGSGDGWLYFYSDDSPANSADLRFRELTTGITEVAISMDGTLVVAGNSAGDLWAYSFDPVLLKTGTVRKAALGSPVREIALADDGKTVAIAHGTSISHYAIETTALVRLWTDTLTSSSGDVAIDGTGEHVAAANGTGAVIYDARHQVGLAPGGARTTGPGMVASHLLTFTNLGNRVEQANLALQVPTGWMGNLNTTSFRINPESGRTVQVNYTVPAKQPAGTYDLSVLSDLGKAGSHTTALKVAVPAVESYSLEAEGPTSLGIQAGGSNTFVVQLENTGNVAGTPAVTAAISPSDWSVTLAGDDGALAAGDRWQLTVTVTAPAGKADGSQGKATLVLPGAVGSPLELFATVGATFGVALDGPAEVESSPGQAFPVKLSVRNIGNAPDVYEVQAGNLPTGWSASSPAPVAIGPGETQDVTVTITRPAGSSSSSSIELQFTATSMSAGAKTDTHKVLVSPPSEAGTTSMTSTSKGTKGSPGVEATLLVMALALAVAFARRRMR